MAQETTTCPICIEEIASDCENKHTLSCGHGFHATCLVHWALESSSRTCPMCRNDTSGSRLGRMTALARAAHIRRTVARRRVIPEDLRRLVDQVKKAEESTRKVSKELAEERRRNREVLTKMQRLRVKRWKTKAREMNAKRVLGCYHHPLLSLPGLATF